MQDLATKVATGARVAAGAVFLIPHAVMAVTHAALEAIEAGARWSADQIEAFAKSTADGAVALYNRVAPADWKID